MSDENKRGPSEAVATVIIGPDDLVAVDLLVDNIEVGTTLYTHADPGEVERMRAELESMNEIFGTQEDKIDGLRARLGERDALIKRCEVAVGSYDGALYEELRAISASADPATPEAGQ